MAVANTRNPFTNDIGIVSQAPPDKISDIVQRILQGQQVKMRERDKMRKMAMNLYLFTRANESSTGHRWLPTTAGKMPIIPSSYARISCASLGVYGLLHQLNDILGTSYTPPPLSLFMLLQFCVSAEYDFGTAYSLLRPRWFAESYSTTIQDELYNLRREDQEMRRQVLVNNQIRIVMAPRRVWDLHGNRVVPYCFTLEEPWAISYARKRRVDSVGVITDINGKEWPVMIPKGADFDTIREELLKMGVEYVWLDILCLRQKDVQREDLRVEEWKTDVPTIGNVYRWAEVVVYYFEGLGSTLCSKTDNFHDDDRCWFNRAWPFQEDNSLKASAGHTDDSPPHASRTGGAELTRFHKELASMPRGADLFSILADMRERVSTNPVDRVVGLTWLLFPRIVPAYYESQTVEDAWTALVNTMDPWARSSIFFSFPEAGSGSMKWRPSWDQVMTQFLPPDVVYHGSLRHEWDQDSCEEHCIEQAFILGLDQRSADSVDRYGELVVGDDTFKVRATHQYPIPEGIYTLLGDEAWSYWVVGRRLPDQRYEKLSVFEMTDSEDVKRLMDLGVAKMSRNILI